MSVSLLPGEIVVDAFAGGGGASTGIEQALGRCVDIAINHNPMALAMHAANHPGTLHLPHNVWKVDPVAACRGRPVGLLWASPDCKHFSKAKGGAPVKRNIRDLAWVVVRWARQVRPRVIMLENVEEFRDWGPIGEDGRPCRDRRGQTFKAWVAELRRLGYRVECRELRACDFGAPTIRKRLFLIARRDGRPIVWPKPTHGAPDHPAVFAGKLAPWRTAAGIIDWSLPCPSIFATSEEIMARHGVKAVRPLAENTLARVAKGLKRYVLDAASPFIVSVAHGHSGGRREYELAEPLGTTKQSNTHALATPFLTKFRSGATGAGLDEPAPTITANSFIKRPGGAAPVGLVAAFLAQNNFQEPGHDARTPVSTIVATGSTQSVVTASFLSHQYSSATAGGEGDLRKPIKTVTAGGLHAAEVRAFLIKYYGNEADGHDLADPLGTVTTRDRFGLVTVGGEEYRIVDIGLRMLTPRELFRAQGFPDSYIIDHGILPDGSRVVLTKTQQVGMCGNSVCPPLALALVTANLAIIETERGPIARPHAPAPLLELAGAAA